MGEGELELLGLTHELRNNVDATLRDAVRVRLTAEAQSKPRNESLRDILRKS
jgi:hypothetical protein